MKRSKSLIQTKIDKVIFINMKEIIINILYLKYQPKITALIFQKVQTTGLFDHPVNIIFVENV